jgi:hypothetical protein
LGHGGPSIIEEKDAHGARNRHSDKEKFRSDLNRPKIGEMSERLLKALRNSGDFQAEQAPGAASTLQTPTIRLAAIRQSQARGQSPRVRQAECMIGKMFIAAPALRVTARFESPLADDRDLPRLN